MPKIKYELLVNRELIHGFTSKEVGSLEEANREYNELREELDSKTKPGEHYRLEFIVEGIKEVKD